MDKGKCSEPGCENPNVLIFGTLDFCEKHAREITSNNEKLKENYKGFVVFGHWYLGKKFYWGIETKDGQEIANTLWNDDKACRSREEAIERAKRSLDYILKTKPERDSYFSCKFLQSLREPETAKQDKEAPNVSELREVMNRLKVEMAVLKHVHDEYKSENSRESQLKAIFAEAQMQGLQSAIKIIEQLKPL